MPFLRLGFLCLLLAGFAYGFASLVDHVEGGRISNELAQCRTSSDPACYGPTLR